MPTMNAISASELAQIQTDVASAVLDKTCVIKRVSTATPDSRGVPSSSYSTIATVAAGMRQPTSTHLTNYDYIIGALAAWLVHMPINTNVKAQDHLEIDNQTLVVQVILTPQSFPALLSVIASELK